MMGIPSKAEIERMRKVYTKGKRIVLISMDDPYAHPNPGEKGTVDFVDDIGQIHVRWDCGSSLAVISGVDSFRMEE